MNSRESVVHSLQKKNTLFIVCCLMLLFLTGCARLKECAKGFAGISTKVLENSRKDALKDIVAHDFDTAYDKTKEILVGREAYIYAQDRKKGMIAAYISKDDTTPVGIFLEVMDLDHTRIEVSSPSVYAKEFISALIFGYFNPENSSGDVQAADKIK